MDNVGRFIYLSEEMLTSLNVTTGESIESIENVIRALADGEAWASPKSAILIPDGRYFMSTLAISSDPALLAVKSLVLNPKNTQRGLAQINSVVTVLDGHTGLPVAVVDGNWVTAIRTAGLSAVAAKRMARADSKVVAFIGCGVQAHSHLQAFSDLFPLTEVRAFGRGTTNRDLLCENAESRGYKAVSSASGQGAIEGADLIVTSVTLSATFEPFLDAGGLKPGAFAAVTDFARPWHWDSMKHLDRVIIDDIEQESTSESMVNPDLIKGDLRGLVTGKVVARADEEERNAFVFRGLSIGDLALAGVAVRKALQANVGAVIA
jgi:ornithine cyclodeaminase/alanine dehydrogenase-like protein (mu-crystallin family)